VVLHLGEHHGVAGADVRPPPRVRDQVDRLGGVLREDDLLVARAEVAGDPPAGPLERVGRLLAERVDGAVDVGVVLGEPGVHRVEHRLRLLRGVRAVEVAERPAAELPPQDRELLGHALGVERGGCGG
jgi:hypothetical protein